MTSAIFANAGIFVSSLRYLLVIGIVRPLGCSTATSPHITRPVPPRAIASRKALFLAPISSAPPQALTIRFLVRTFPILPGSSIFSNLILSVIDMPPHCLQVAGKGEIKVTFPREKRWYSSDTFPLFIDYVITTHIAALVRVSPDPFHFFAKSKNNSQDCRAIRHCLRRFWRLSPSLNLF